MARFKNVDGERIPFTIAEEASRDAEEAAAAVAAQQPPDAAQIKTEAYRRIVAIAPEWKQRNMTAAGVAMLSKLIDGGTLTAEELAAKAEYFDIWTQIDAIRSKSNEIEALDPIPVDYTDDIYWS